MTTRCKVGDLAYLSSDCVDEGVIVEVLSAGPPVDGNPTWHCKSRTPIRCDRLVSGSRDKGEFLMTDICVEDRYLRPLSGPSFDIDEDVSEDREVTA